MHANLDLSLPEHRPFPFRRPAVRAREHLVVSGHWLSSAAAQGILARGGNAFDAGVAAGLCLNVVLPQWTSLGGVAPIVTYRAADRALSTVSGLGWWPRRASVQFFEQHCGGNIPLGVLRSVVPSACDAWLTTLKLYGTLSLAEVAAPAIDLAERGFPAYPLFVKWMGVLHERFQGWPSSAAALLDDNRVPELGWLVRQPALARTLKRLCQAEARAAGGSRERGIQAARDEFYHGEIAREMVEWYREQGGLLEQDDLADFSVEVEPPVSTSYGPYQVHGCGFWCQGPVLQQTLNLLEGSGVEQLEHNTVEYVHLVAEALKLAFADRHAYYGDPRRVEVPAATLLSKEYAASRRALIRADRAWPEMPPASDLGPGARPTALASAAAGGPRDGVPDLDTSYLCVVDAAGNAMSATPSDGCHGGPLVPSLGHLVSTRGGQSWLDPNHPASVAGRKRPRLTPNPALVTRDGRLVLAFGTPGSDAQAQAMAQVFLNVTQFGMDPQRAVEEPRFITLSHPDTAHPHRAQPGRLELERGFAPEAAEALRARGHDVQRWEWDTDTGTGVCLIQVDAEHGSLVGGADPRRDSYAIGW
jgi:gamma-glutamyltranspeptidase/glutathione hydrolase